MVKTKYFYGYNIVAACFIIQGVSYGAMFTYGVFFKEFQAEFGWSRAMISGASSLSLFLGGAMGVLAGRLNDRIGPIGLTVGTSIPMGIGFLLLSRLQSPWQLYLIWGVLVCTGLGTHDVITLSTLARWFIKRRGMMSGIVKIGTGAGQLMVPLLAAVFISAYGWRNAYIILGAVILLILLAVAQVMRHDPQGMGLLPDNAEKALNTDRTGFTHRSVSLRSAARTLQFWAICLAELTSFFCLLTIIVHIVPHAMDLGLPPGTAAGVISAIGGVSMLGRVVMGTASDRIGGKRSLIICFSVLFCALLWLQVARETWMLFLFAAIYGFAHGGLFTVVAPALAELFGTGSHGVLFGIVLFSGNIGAAIGPILAGYVFDVTGSYRMIFFILAGAAALGIGLTSLLKPIKHIE
jgi:MFS family permease